MATTPTVWKNIGLVNTNNVGPGGNSQNEAVVVGLAGGGFVVAWSDDSHTGIDTTNKSVKFQIYDHLGQKVGGEQTVLGTDSIGVDDFAPAIAALPSGGFAITVLGNGGLGLVLFDADGDFAGDGNAFSDFSSSSVTSLSDGSTFVAAGANQMGDLNALGLQADPTGDFVNAINILNQADDQQFPDVATLSNGNVVVAYEDQIGAGSADFDIVFGIFDSSGMEVRSRTPLAINLTPELAPSVAALKGGGFVTAWVDTDGFGGDTMGTAIVAEIRDNNGDQVVADFLVNTTVSGNQIAPQVAALPDGRFVVVWVESGNGLLGQVFDATGTKVGTEFNFLTSGTIDFQPGVAALSDGRFVVTKTVLVSGNEDVVARIFDPRGDVINGTNGDDVIAARLEGGRVNALDGADHVHGQGSRDILIGGDGNDVLLGGGGNDYVRGQADNDFLRGGADNDLVIGDSGLDRMFGDAGNDRMFGGDDRDRMFGGDDRDLLRGQNGSDILFGNDGADRIFGDADNDFIIGGLGRDLLAGGTGRDRFIYTSIADSQGADRDKIFGFEQGLDDIDLRKIDADTNVAGNQRFFFLGEDAFTGLGGEVRARQVANFVRVEADVDGDAQADFTIDVTGTTFLTKADFFL